MTPEQELTAMIEAEMMEFMRSEAPIQIAAVDNRTDEEKRQRISPTVTVSWLRSVH